jgi:phenylalanyl-tRNA synthetase beta chain
MQAFSGFWIGWLLILHRLFIDTPPNGGYSTGFIKKIRNLDMKIFLNWLRDYVDFDLSAEQIGSLMSDRGFPYEEIVRVGSDTVIDFEITSNRPDCLSHIGIAREFAAATGKKLRMPEIKLPESQKKAADVVSVEIKNPDLCGRYTAHVIEGVKIGPTPDWMRARLEAVGLRSINNVVDATNYAMMETGQPPHAFDYAKIAGAKIIVRTAAAGERIVSIDGTKCDLATDMLVIADGQKPVGIAGVMGGLDSEVSDGTKTVLLEDAYFAPLTIRTTSRRLAIRSDAAYRFERNVDIEMIDWASRRTAQLITMVAGGTVLNGVVDAYPKKPAAKIITLRLARLESLLGIKAAEADVLAILNALDFKPQKKSAGVLECIVPSWRNDVYREVDLIEEFARMHGYNKIHTEQKISIEVAPVDQRHKFLTTLRRILNAAGFFETINVTFVDDLMAELFSGVSKDEHLGVKDVSRKSANLLRRTLIGSLAQCAKTNYNAKNANISLYEIADTFKPKENSPLPLERTSLAMITDKDFRFLRGVIENIINQLDRDAQLTFIPAEVSWADTAAQITAKGKVIGMAGAIKPAVLEKLDIKNVSMCAAELDCELLAEIQSGPKKLRPIPRFPAVQRDLSIIIDEQTPWSEVIAAINRKAPRQLENVDFAGIYRGKPIPTGKKSVTLTLRFRDDDGTLTHEMVDSFQNEIMAELAAAIAAQLRTA